jgi:small GTP-binding protein
MAQWKVVFGGETGVGKTSIIQCQLRGVGLLAGHEPTVGASYSDIRVEAGGREANLQAWDTAGQEKYRSLCPMYFRSAAAAVIVYDLTSRASFEQVRGWFEMAIQFVDKQCQYFLVGNKSDLEERIVDDSAGTELAQEFGAALHRTSARTGEGIVGLFGDIGEKMIARPDLAVNASITSDEPEASQCGC